MNLVIGDYIEFKLPQFEGGSFYSQRGWRGGSKGTYVGDKSFAGTVENDWYDSNGRHWFSVRLGDGKLKRVQGKNLYPGVTEYAKGKGHEGAADDKQFRKIVQTGGGAR